MAQQADNWIRRQRLYSRFASWNRRFRDILADIVECDRDALWEQDGSYDFAQWLSAELGISHWAARRWINAAYTLPRLPRVADAFDNGELCLEKVLELCRFVTPATEAEFVNWAKHVTVGRVRAKANLEKRRPEKEATDIDKSRYLNYWFYDEGRRFALQGDMPADQGAVVAKALDRLADRLPDIVDEDEDAIQVHDDPLAARRADALVAMASTRIAESQDPDRATIVVHAPVEALAGAANAEIEGGGVIPSQTLRRLACDSRIELSAHGTDGRVVGIGRTSRKPSRWLLRALRHRDGECAFPGCHARHFLKAHHIVHWIDGGPTDLDNLVLVCHAHHKLIHEYGWNLQLGDPGITQWFRPGGRPYEPGPARIAPAEWAQTEQQELLIA